MLQHDSLWDPLLVADDIMPASCVIYRNVCVYVLCIIHENVCLFIDARLKMAAPVLLNCAVRMISAEAGR